VCDTGIGYPAFALGYQTDAGNAARTIGAKEPAIEAFLATVAPRLQVDDRHYANVSAGYNLLHKACNRIRIRKIDETCSL